MNECLVSLYATGRVSDIHSATRPCRVSINQKCRLPAPFHLLQKELQQIFYMEKAGKRKESLLFVKKDPSPVKALRLLNLLLIQNLPLVLRRQSVIILNRGLTANQERGVL
ncbi:MAG TPA: hypothetical protein IAD07_06725 [Candidatus Fimivicinus intestinavium]|nr:hypothetical protein [Candidatus Fimivicinus intestinavium]